MLDNDSLLALLALVQDVPAAASDATKDWLTLQFSIGDLTSVGSVIAAYVALRERLAKLETKVEPIWNSWNRRHEDRREE